MNLNEQTNRIKQMMGVNTLSEQVLAQITGLDSSMSLLKDVDPKLMKIY